jgi:hypothetical protein
MADVFISYASIDRPQAAMIADGLREHGLSFWMDVASLQAGDSWQDETIRAIQESRVFVLVYSSSADASRQVNRELGLAVRNGTPIVPVRIDTSTPSDRLGYELGRAHWIDATDRSREWVARLVDAIERTLGDVAPPSQAPPSSAASPARATESPPQPTRQLLGGIIDLLSRLVAKLVSPPEGASADSIAEAAALVEALSAPRLEDLADRRISPAARQHLASISPEIFDGFDAVARAAGQIQRLQDPGRRLEALESALEMLSELRTSLANEHGLVASTLTQMATQWTSLFVTGAQSAKEEIEAAREIENPFISGNPVRPHHGDLFTGRKDIVLEIERNILGAAEVPTLLLYGQRRMGKTSILYQLPELLGPRFLPIQIDCQAPAMVESPAAMLRYLSRVLSNALNSRLGIAADDEAARVARGATPIPLEALGEAAFAAFDEWLDTYQLRLPQQSFLLLCLDEFERLNEAVAAGWGARLLDTLRHWAQHRRNFALMFIGSHTFEQLGPNWTDRFLSARRLKVSFLSYPDVEQLLTHPTPDFRLTYDPETLAAIYRTTHGQPFLTQALAFELVNHMNREGRRRAHVADAEAAVEHCLDSAADYFADLWSSRSDAERGLMRELASGPWPSSRGRLTDALRDYDVLDENGQFAVPLVRLWVQRHPTDESIHSRVQGAG